MKTMRQAFKVGFGFTAGCFAGFIACKVTSKVILEFSKKMEIKFEKKETN